MNIEEKLKNMSASELAEEQINASIKAILMAFIEGFKLSTKKYNWEIFQYKIEYNDCSIKDFFNEMKEEFKKVSGFNE